MADKVVVVQPATNELPNNEIESPDYTLAVKCVIWHTDSTFTAYFSYQNNLTTNQPLQSSTLSAGSGTAPQVLFPGVHAGAFTVNAPMGTSITWSTSATTNGTTVTGTATATDAATRCNTPADINWLVSPDSVQRLSYTQRDGLGSVVGKTDLSVKYQAQRVSGSVSVSNTPIVQQAQTYATQTYNAYGIGSRNETPYSPEASGNSKWSSTTYSGKQFDPETGFNNYGSRYYDASNGTWNKADSYRGETINPITRNRYTFVNNNPVNMVDAYGYSAVSPTGINSAIAAASQALQSLQSTRNSVASQQANLISQKNKLQSQLPALAANMNNAYWSAKLAGDYSRLNYQMQFVVSRLEARGYGSSQAIY